MSAEVHVRTLEPEEYYREFLEQETRPDGRSLGEFRPTIVNIGSITTADGSALVKQGNTTVLCGIKAELALPKAELPKQGFVIPNVELPPMCSAQFKMGPPPEEAQVASQLLDDIIHSSNCVNFEDLCVVEGKTVWALYCDIICLDHDGNVIDVCVTALLAALKNMSLPEVKLDEETGLLKANMEKRSHLAITSEPVSSTFSLFNDKIIFVDPTKEEEELCSGMATIVTKSNGEICTVFKPGGSPLKESQLQECMSTAKTRAKEVCRLIDEAILSVER